MANDTSSPLDNFSDPWVLIVDDDEALRFMLTQALAGEAVTCADVGSGHEALLLLDRQSTEPILTIIDVMMPGMDGLTLARKLLSRLKHGKIVLMSGHLSQASWWPADLRKVPFIEKPFNLADLHRVLREARAGSGCNT